MGESRIYPWASFTQFLEAVGKFEDIPPVFEAEKLDVVKGYADQIISAFRFLGFADNYNVPTEEFKRFIREKNNRPHIMEKLLRNRYPEIFSNITLTTEITDKLLWDTFSKCSSSDNTIRKMISFFKQAALYSEMNISASSRSSRGRKIHLSHNRKDVVINASAATVQANAVSPSSTTGTTKTIPLKNGGGTITLTVIMDPFIIDEEDQTLIFGIIKSMNAYHAKYQLRDDLIK
jgi:hypothetical protein